MCWLGDPKQRKAHGGSSNSSQNLTCGIVQKTRAQEENGIKISSHQYSANPNDRQTITGNRGLIFYTPWIHDRQEHFQGKARDPTEEREIVGSLPSTEEQRRRGRDAPTEEQRPQQK